jgi:hypothetical protein
MVERAGSVVEHGGEKETRENQRNCETTMPIPTWPTNGAVDSGDDDAGVSGIEIRVQSNQMPSSQE